tara:strand:+ start:1614 stop:1871 length:258 start_codon:yes stop_codon:yes gene_type:complete
MALGNSSKITITIHSDLDFENLAAEILIDGKFIGLVTNEPNQNLRFVIPKGELKFEQLDLDTFQEALTLAKRELAQSEVIKNDNC